MPTEVPPAEPPRRRRVVAAIVWALGAFVVSPTVHAQIEVGPNTEVESIEFEGVESLSKAELRALMRTRGRTALFGIRSVLGKLPFLKPPPRYPFSPRVLQEDVVRVRNAYALAGYLEADVRYEAERAGEDLLDITIFVEEGQPQRVVEVTVAPPDSLAALPVQTEDRASWDRAVERALRLEGRPLHVVEARAERDRLQSWWRERGFARAVVRGDLQRDSLRSEGSIHYVVYPGRRTLFGPISVEGNEHFSEGTTERQLAFQSGDEFSESAFQRSREDLQRLEIVRSAHLELQAPVDSTEHDSTAIYLPVRVRITENKTRLVTGQLGFVTDGGISTQADWSHLSFARGARVLTVSALAQTGLLSVTSNADERYRGSISLLQPQVFDRRLSVVVSPFVQYRDDTEERSFEVGSNFTLVYEPTRRFNGSLDYRISTREIYEYRFGDIGSGDVNVLSLLLELLQGETDSLGTHVATSLLTLSGSMNSLDNLANPRLGVLVRPALQVTFPTSWASESYWRADLSSYGFLPMTDHGVLAGRLTVGRAFPFGKSLPQADESPAAAFLKLRDATFTAGGSADVRGWGSQLLGPKFPAIRFVEEGDSLTTETSGYVALGGLSRVSFTVEARLPMPLLGTAFGSHLFLDGGRVWTQDERYEVIGEDVVDQDRFFYATGGGVDYKTPVGSIRLSVGYKLNPSILDLADSDDVLRAVLEGSPLDQIETHGLRRWQLHFAFGSSY